MKNTIKFILFFAIIFAILLIAPNIVNAATQNQLLFKKKLQ